MEEKGKNNNDNNNNNNNNNNNKDRKEHGGGDASYSFLKLICKASLIFKSNLGIALLII